MTPVTLQISLSPLDMAHAALIVPHQLQHFASQCQQVLLVWDLDPGLRYQEVAFRQRWDQGVAFIELFHQALQQEFPQLESLHLKASDTRAEAAVRPYIASLNTGSAAIPAKDFRGGPFLSYLYALASARFDHVLHLDSDMMFAGNSSGWVASALEALQADSDLFCVSPPGGPLKNRPATRHVFFTTRHFLSDRRRWLNQIQLQIRPQTFTDELAKEIHAEVLENTLSQWMQQQGLFRLDHAGPDAGFCSLHPPVPPHRDFMTCLPKLLDALSQGWMPECQYGHYNLQTETLATLISG